VLIDTYTYLTRYVLQIGVLDIPHSLLWVTVLLFRHPYAPAWGRPGTALVLLCRQLTRDVGSLGNVGYSLLLICFALLEHLEDCDSA